MQFTREEIELILKKIKTQHRFVVEPRDKLIERCGFPAVLDDQNHMKWVATGHYAICAGGGKSRGTIELDTIGQEPLQSISLVGLAREGMGLERNLDAMRTQFRAAWEASHGRESWEMNPRVWVLSFRLVDDDG